MARHWQAALFALARLSEAFLVLRAQQDHLALVWIPLVLIVMSVVLLAPSIESSLGEMRLAIPSTALLTLVFLQQTYKAELPSTPYLTFLDELYAYSYLVAVGLFILFLWGSNRMEAAAPERRQAVQRSINTICQWGALLGLGAVAVVAWRL